MPHEQRLHELLERAGLTVVEDVLSGSLFPPEAGWRIARGIAAPDCAAREALDAAWWRRLRDADGEFLVVVLVYRIGGNDSRWTRVRYTGSGVPELTGDPGFVALSLDGQVLLAQVPGVDGPRVTALDRLPEGAACMAVSSARVGQLTHRASLLLAVSLSADLTVFGSCDVDTVNVCPRPARICSWNCSGCRREDPLALECGTWAGERHLDSPAARWRCPRLSDDPCPRPGGSNLIRCRRGPRLSVPPGVVPVERSPRACSRCQGKARCV